MKRVLPVLFVLLATIFVWFQSTYHSPAPSTTDLKKKVPPVVNQSENSKKFPFTDADRIREINNTLERIRTGEKKFKQDGAIFRNAEGLLPEKPQDYYREYTVLTPGAENRGTRRIVQGRGGETYYSDDHYKSFIEINSNGVP